MAPRNNDAGTSFSSKKKSFPTEEIESETDLRNIVSSLLHKKHKVIKMVKSQLKKIQEEGISCDLSLLGSNDYALEENKKSKSLPRGSDLQKQAGSERTTRFTSFGENTYESFPSEGSETIMFENYGDVRANREGTNSESIYRRGTSDSSDRERKGKAFASKCCWFLLFLLILFQLVLLMVWISAGPLSFWKPHTPITSSSFVGTDSLCTLEKKYLQRWSQPQYFE